MKFNKNGLYYYRQIPINFGQTGCLKAFISFFNKKEKRKGEFFARKYEELISNVINDSGRIPTLDNQPDYEHLLYLLNFDNEEENKEFIDGLIKFGLIKLIDDKKSYFLSDYANFIGAKKNKTEKKKKSPDPDSDKSFLTDKQRRLYEMAKAKGYKGTIEEFISGKDLKKINDLINYDENVIKLEDLEDDDGYKLFDDPEDDSN